MTIYSPSSPNKKKVLLGKPTKNQQPNSPELPTILFAQKNGARQQKSRRSERLAEPPLRSEAKSEAPKLRGEAALRAGGPAGAGAGLRRASERAGRTETETETETKIRRRRWLGLGVDGFWCEGAPEPSEMTQQHEFALFWAKKNKGGEL